MVENEFKWKKFEYGSGEVKCCLAAEIMTLETKDVQP
jgi:hypothetical protein